MKETESKPKRSYFKQFMEEKTSISKCYNRGSDEYKWLRQELLDSYRDKIRKRE